MSTGLAMMPSAIPIQSMNCESFFRPRQGKCILMVYYFLKLSKVHLSRMPPMTNITKERVNKLAQTDLKVGQVDMVELRQTALYQKIT